MPRLMVPTSPIPVAERSMAMAPSFLFITYSVTEDSADEVCDMAVESPEFSPRRARRIGILAESYAVRWTFPVLCSVH